MTIAERNYFKNKLLMLRKSIQILEEELGDNPPVLPKRRSFKSHLEQTAAIGIWRKPEHLKVKNKKVDALTSTGI